MWRAGWSDWWSRVPILVVVSGLVRVKLALRFCSFSSALGETGNRFCHAKSAHGSTSERGADGELLPDDRRLTSFGRLLRSTSLDELPGLWNVLVGDMSLVGPRPLLMRYLDRYTPVQARRHEVRPGITGLAQVSGRNALSWEDRFDLDVWYVDQCSLSLDLSILWRTVSKVFKREGISAEGQATMSGVRRDHSRRHVKAPVYLVGAGGHARVILSMLDALGRQVGGIFDDSPDKHGTRIAPGHAIVAPSSDRSLVDRWCRSVSQSGVI